HIIMEVIMKTKRMLIVLFFLAELACSFELRAQFTGGRGFGVGLSHTDSGEVITYLSRESPLHDDDVVLGDKIVAFNGKPLVGEDILLTEAIGLVDTLTVRVRRSATGEEFSAVILRSKQRQIKGGRCGMLDKTIAYIKLSAFDADSVDVLESMLD